jgi:hypothetical protein
MSGFMPGIHVFTAPRQEKRGWPDKPGHDAAPVEDPVQQLEQRAAISRRDCEGR